MAASMASKLGAIAALGGRQLMSTSSPSSAFDDLLDMFIGMYDDIETLKTEQANMITQVADLGNEVDLLEEKQITSDLYHFNKDTFIIPANNHEHKLHSWTIPAGETMDFYIIMTSDEAGRNNDLWLTLRMNNVIVA